MPDFSATGNVALHPVALAVKTYQGEDSDRKKQATGVTNIPPFLLFVNGEEGTHEHSAATSLGTDSYAAPEVLMPRTSRSRRRNSFTTFRETAPIKSPAAAIDDWMKTSLRRSRSADSCPRQKSNFSQHPGSTPGTTTEPEKKREVFVAVPSCPHRSTTAEIRSPSFDVIPFPDPIKAKLKHSSTRDGACTVLLSVGGILRQSMPPTSLHFGIQRVSVRMLESKKWELSAPIEWMSTVVSPVTKFV